MKMQKMCEFFSFFGKIRSFKFWISWIGSCCENRRIGESTRIHNDGSCSWFPRWSCSHERLSYLFENVCESTYESSCFGFVEFDGICSFCSFFDHTCRRRAYQLFEKTMVWIKKTAPFRKYFFFSLFSINLSWDYGELFHVLSKWWSFAASNRSSLSTLFHVEPQRLFFVDEAMNSNNRRCNPRLFLDATKNSVDDMTVRYFRLPESARSSFEWKIDERNFRENLIKLNCLDAPSYWELLKSYFLGPRKTEL